MLQELKVFLAKMELKYMQDKELHLIAKAMKVIGILIPKTKDSMDLRELQIGVIVILVWG